MNTRLKKTAALIMSVLVVFSSLGNVSVSAEKFNKPEEHEADTPAKYTVTLPYYEECGYSYDSARVKEKSGDIKLLYEAKEKVAVALQSTGQAHIDQVKIVDSENHEVSSSWNGSKTEFTMPKRNVRLNVSFVTPQTEPLQTDAPQTDVPQAESSQAESPQTDSSQTDVPQSELAQSDSSQADMPQSELSQAASTQTDLPQAAPPQTELPETETNGTDIVQTEFVVGEIVKDDLVLAEPAVEESIMEDGKNDFLRTETVESDITQSNVAQTDKTIPGLIKNDMTQTVPNETNLGSFQENAVQEAPVETESYVAETETETIIESETLAERDLVNGAWPETEPMTEMDITTGAIEEEYVTYSMEGEGVVTIFTRGEDGNDEVLCSLHKSGESKRVSVEGVEDMLYVRMTPNTGWYPYEMSDGENTAGNLFTQTDEMGRYEGSLFFASRDMSFRFIDEETLAGIPMLLGDGSMRAGGDYYWVYQKGATKGADIADPKKNDIFVVSATYKQHCNKENGGYTEFVNHPGSAVIPEDSEIAQYLGSTFKFNTCGVGSKPVPQTGNKGKLYILIKSVTKTSTGTKVSYQYFFWNSVAKYQSVYYKGTKTYTLYGLKIIKTLENEEDVAGCSAYDLAATFTIKDSKGKVVKTVTTDKESGEVLITDLDEGTYTITETKTSKGATAYVGKGKTVEYTKEKITSVKFQNYPVLIELTVDKRDSDGEWDDSMKGAVYSLRDDKDDEKTEIEKVTINSKSVKVKTPLCLNKTYYLVEISEPTSGQWALNSKPMKVSTAVSAEKMETLKGSDNVVKMTSRVIEYRPSPIKVRLEKKTNLIESANGNKAEWLDNGYYNLKGAVYEFYSDKACKDLIGTAVIKDKNSEGHYYSNWVEIPITDVNAKTITVYYRETKRPNGHIQDPEGHSLKLNVPEDVTKTVSVTEEAVDDFTYARLDALVTKVSSTGEPLEGAEFTLTYYAKPQSDEIVYQWVFRTNSEGKLDLWKPVNGEKVFVNNPGTAILFPEGYYSIQETKAPDGYVNAGFYKEFTLTPSKDENGYYTIRRCELPETYTVVNSGTSDVRIRKVSTISGYDAAGCVFEVSLTSDFSKVVGTLTSKEGGYSDYLEIDGSDYKDYLVGGYFDVYVREISVPEWFTLSKEVEHGICIPGKQTTVTFRNAPKGSVTVTKESANPDITAGNGMYSFAGAKFNISSTADMRNVVAILTAKADGTTDPVLLDAGTYYVQESNAPKGYKRNARVYDVTVAAGDTASVTIEDEPITGNVKVLLEKVPNGSTTRPLAGAEFTVRYFDNEDCGGTPTRTWVLKSGDNGKVLLKNDSLVSGDNLYREDIIPLGSLRITETKAPEGYIISDEVKQVTISGNGTDEGVLKYTNEATFMDTPSFGGVRIAKTCIDMGQNASGDASLGGAVYQIINNDTVDLIRVENPKAAYAPGQEMARITTNSEGIAEIGVALQTGKYIIKEVSPSPGYLVNTSYSQEFEITEDGQIVDLTGTPAVEPIIRGGFTLEKWDAERNEAGLPQGEASLAGAEFTLTNCSAGTVKVDINQNGILEDSERFAPGEIISVFTTDEKGCLSTPADYLPYGTYILTETKAPEGYTLDGTNLTRTIQIRTNGQYDRYTTENSAAKDLVIRGGFALEKWDAERNEAGIPQGDASLAGAEFTLVNDGKETVLVDVNRDGQFSADEWFAPGEVVTVLTTDENGRLSTSADYLPYGTYTLTETKAPEGYILDNVVNQIHTIQIRTDGQYDSFTQEANATKDYVARGGFELEKWDKEKNEANTTQGDASLTGAEFILKNSGTESVLVDVDGDGTFGENELFAPGDTIKVFTTDTKGYLSTPANYLPYGTYTLTETKPPLGYTTDGENLTRVIRIREDGQYDSYTTKSNAAKNRVIRGDLELIKFRDTLSDQEPGDDVIPVKGCEFEVRLKSTGELFCTLVTDEYGYATTADRDNYPYGRLPYGTYTLTETKWPDDLNPVKPFDVTIDIDRKVYRGIYKNDQPIEMPITLVKADVESGLTIPIAGTEFQILDADKNVITFTNHYPHEEKIANFITDESGTITLPEKLPFGTYYVREVNAPLGYLRDDDLEFQVTESGKWAEPMTITYQDRPAKGKVKVAKYDAETKELISGAVFSIFAAEDIVTGDGITHFADGTYVGTFTIGDDGVGYSDELYLGKYYLQEAKAPEGYCLDTDRHYFELEYEDQDTQILIREMDCLNKPTTMKLYKTDADGTALDGVNFELRQIGIVATSSEGAKDGETAAEEKKGDPIATHVKDDMDRKEGSDTSDGTVETEGIYVSSNGGFIMEKYLVSGIYSLTETATLPGYVLDKNPRYVTVDRNGFIYESDIAGNDLDVDKAKSDIVTLEWRNDYTKWDFSKIDVAGQEIEGAEMEIRNQNGEIVYSWTSDGAPHRIEKIPAGIYILAEKTAPEGYVLAEEMEFEVTNTGIVQKAEMMDKRVLVSKKRITGSEELPGATLTVLDSKGTVVDTWVSSDTPHPVVGLKPKNTYTLREETAPTGYAKAEEVMFTVLDDSENQTVEMRDELLLIDISKTDISTGEELPGAKLTVRDKTGEIVEEWISTEEPHRMNLPAGEYTLTETMAPEKYATAENITFVVEETAGVQKVEMKDAPIQVSISKQDIATGKELPGAKLTVTDKDGNVVEEWVSTEEPHKMSLAVGTYLLNEIAAPDKYATAESIEFEVKDTAEIQKVEMKDAPIQVSISKKDITNDKELPGAKLIIKDSDEKTVEEWISTDKEHLVNLPTGKYTLTEVTAPNGYEVAETIHFEVTDSIEVQHVTMYDSPKKEEKEPPQEKDTKKPTPKKSSGQAKTVKTGDVFRYLPAMILIGLGAILVIGGRIRRGQSKKK